MDDNKFRRRQAISLITSGILFTLILVFVVGYTYSYFTARATNSSVITGKVESNMLSLNVQEVVPKNNAKLIPQLDGAITSAVTGRQGNCIDDNGNTVCKVYSVTIKNLNSTAPIYVNANLSLSIIDSSIAVGIS